MSVQPLDDHDQEMPAPQGHAIGFANSKAICDEIVEALNAADVPDSAMTVLSGEDGIHLLKRMMGGSLWGETAENVMNQGVIELNHGHFAIIVETKNRDEAVIAANIATAHGGHSFNHFGVLSDERLTK